MTGAGAAMGEVSVVTVALMAGVASVAPKSGVEVASPSCAPSVLSYLYASPITSPLLVCGLLGVGGGAAGTVGEVPVTGTAVPGARGVAGKVAVIGEEGPVGVVGAKVVAEPEGVRGIAPWLEVLLILSVLELGRGWPPVVLRPCGVTLRDLKLPAGAAGAAEAAGAVAVAMVDGAGAFGERRPRTSVLTASWWSASATVAALCGSRHLSLRSIAVWLPPPLSLLVSSPSPWLFLLMLVSPSVQEALLASLVGVDLFPRLEFSALPAERG
jgi:hypothetical protein